TQGGEPSLILSIDYTGDVSSMEFAGIGPLQKYITEQKNNYNKVLIIEPLPGPKPDTDRDWEILNSDSDSKITFFTPSPKATPAQTAKALYETLHEGSTPKAAGTTDLLEQLASDDRAKAADARWQLVHQGPYQVVPRLNNWLAGAEGKTREQRVYDALTIRRAMGVHADAAIAEAAGSENPNLRALAGRSIGDLADKTTDAIGLLTPLAEDDAMTVRYEALVATRAMPGRVAAGVAELVEPYEMSTAMRTVYRGTMAQLLTYGEPIPADSRANRLRRLAINQLLSEERTPLVCTILLERTDLPDDKIDEVLKQLAEASGQGSLTALLNTLEAMNPRTLAKRDVLLKKLVAWKADELRAQTPRLKELARGNGPSNLRQAGAAALIMSSPALDVLVELDNKPIAYEGLGMVSDQATLKQWAVVIMQQARKGTPAETTIAAIDAIQYLPADSLTGDNATMLLGLARESDQNEIRFAAIRAINLLPASVKPGDINDLDLTTIDILAIAGMKYDKETLTVTAGRPVELTLINPDTMEHNLVITKPGQAQGIGAAMSADPAAAAAIGYVPKNNSAVLHYTAMLRPGERYTLRFFAPTTPGLYEYVCTYPGHYTSMRGVLEVVSP
ncbi:MAG: plastocyanin/azurin family copper-binding protein, partial [Phycisphaeraceae bacterium]